MDYDESAYFYLVR